MILLFFNSNLKLFFMFVKSSPIFDDFDLVSDFSDGVEVKSFVKTDYPKIVESHGSVSNWSLQSLMSAGIDPSFSIHTSTAPSRLDEASTSVASLGSVVDSILETSKSE